MKNKKILILANLDVGLYKFRKALIKKLIDQGNEVYISLPKGMLVQNLKEMGCHFIETPVDRRGINPATDFKLMMRYFNILGKIKPDLVITYTIKPNIYGGIAARFKRIPYAVNITGLGTAFQNENMIKKLVVFLYKLSCKKAKTIFFENEGNKQVFIENNIIKEKHDRVMTNDHYILRNDLYAAYNQETKLLNNYFSKFKEEEYPEDWKQKIIKYIYKRLTQSVRQDRGLGVGFHPLEEYPARTMLVEESIFADRVLSSIESEEKKMNNESYRKALGKVIESSSWNYVECVDNPERIIKLEIIKNHLSQIEVYTRQDLVLCRYIGGLRQIAQYKILKLMGKEDTVAMDILREMPFCNSSESSAQDS